MVKVCQRCGIEFDPKSHPGRAKFCSQSCSSRRGTNTCRVDGCDNPAKGQMLCGTHWARMRRHGSTDKPVPPDRRRIWVVPEHEHAAVFGDPCLPPWFWEKVARKRLAGTPEGLGECWQWQGLKPGAYAHFYHHPARKVVRAHRLTYELLTGGSIPVDMMGDHICHDDACPDVVACPHRACVNPAHIRPVTARENSLRGQTVGAANTAKEQCSVHGTPLEWMPMGAEVRRGCKQCRREANRRLAARFRAANPLPSLPPCPVCGAAVERISRNKVPRVYCSPQCRGKALRRRLKAKRAA